MNLDRIFTAALITGTLGKGQALPEMQTPPHRSGKAPGAKERAEAKRLRRARRGWWMFPSGAKIAYCSGQAARYRGET